MNCEYKDIERFLDKILYKEMEKLVNRNIYREIDESEKDTYLERIWKKMKVNRESYENEDILLSKSKNIVTYWLDNEARYNSLKESIEEKYISKVPANRGKELYILQSKLGLFIVYMDTSNSMYEIENTERTINITGKYLDLGGAIVFDNTKLYHGDIYDAIICDSEPYSGIVNRFNNLLEDAIFEKDNILYGSIFGGGWMNIVFEKSESFKRIKSIKIYGTSQQFGETDQLDVYTTIGLPLEILHKYVSISIYPVLYSKEALKEFKQTIGNTVVGLKEKLEGPWVLEEI